MKLYRQRLTSKSRFRKPSWVKHWVRRSALPCDADEVYFNNRVNQVSGKVNEMPFNLKYTPRTDIQGNHGVNVDYGLLAGLDPNRALVFALQARGDKLISRSFTRRHLPIQINPSEEERAVDMEDMRDSLKQSIQALASAIPALATQVKTP